MDISQDNSRRHWIRTALALTAFALWHLALKWDALQLPFMSDEGEYAYQAQVLERGEVPYRDAFNQKPPVVFFLYRAAFLAFGERELAPRLAALLFCWAAALALFAATPRAWTPASRLAAPGIFLALGALPVGDFAFSANTEVFAGGFLSGAALLLLRSSLLGAGLLAGLAFATKQTALWVILAFGGWTYWRHRGRAWSFAAGAAAAPAACAAYFASRGALGDLYEQAWSRNMDYASVMISAGAAGQQLAWLAGTLAPLFILGAWPALLLAGYGLALQKGKAGERPWEALMVLWLAAAAVGACTGLFFFPHYFVLLVGPLSLLAAAGHEALSRRLRRPWWLLPALCLYPALAFARSYRGEPEDLARRLLHPNPLVEAKAVGRAIRDRGAPTDTVYVFGSEPQIYFYSGRRAATKHDFVFPLTLFPRGPAAGQAELRSLEERPPRWLIQVEVPSSVLVASSAGEEFARGLADLLRRRYRLSESYGSEPGRPALLLFELVQ